MIRWTVFLSLVVSLLSGCGEKTPEQKAASEAAMTKIKIERMAREFVSGLLKDPDSAEFRNQSEFCGEVNSKNSFGGFTGFQRFIAASRDLVVLERDSDISAAEFTKAWNQVCLR